jgi:anti-sigma B factor antagonist
VSAPFISVFPVMGKYLSFIRLSLAGNWPWSCHNILEWTLAIAPKEESLPLLADRERVDQPKIDIVDTENGVLASLKGRIDIDSSPTVHDRLVAMLQSSPHPRMVSIDLSAVTHIDSSCVAILIEALKIARGLKTELRLQGLHDHLHRLFEATGILSLFNEGIRR